MGPYYLVFQLSFATVSPPSVPLLPNPNRLLKATSVRCFQRDRKNSGSYSTGRFEFDLEDELYGYGDDGFGFNRSGKERTWWSADDDGDDYDDWELDDEENEFWVFKIIRAFGWMVPAITVSFLLGTSSSNAFIMALAVPLGQAVLSLVFDKLWGSANVGPKPRRRTKTTQKPFARAAKRTKPGERKEEGNRTRSKKGTYQSWVAASDGSRPKGGKRETRFGGWDELDNITQDSCRERPIEEVNTQPKRRKEGKISRKGRVRDTPLLLRLMIAVFPFLSSWTKFLF